MLVRLRKIFNDSEESQTFLAQKLGVTPAYIWEILSTNQQTGGLIRMHKNKQYLDTWVICLLSAL